MRSICHTLCPVVRDETLRLFERVTVAGKPRYLPFDQRVLWIRESGARVVLRHAGVLIREGSGFNDFYGYLTSVEYGVDDVAEWAARCKVVTGDKLTIDLDAEIVERPVMLDESAEIREHNARWDRKKYLDVPGFADGKFWFTSDKPESGEEYAQPPRLERRKIETVEAIYTTATDAIGQVPERLSLWLAERRAAVPEQVKSR